MNRVIIKPINFWQETRMQFIRQAMVLIVATSLLKCAAEGDVENHQGSCQILSCADSVLASSHMRIRFLTPDLKGFCGGGVVEHRAIPIRFVVEKPRHILPAEREDEVTDEEDPRNWVPVSGVGFYPILLQGEGVNSDGVNRADQFKGIETKEEEWCTDTCGVGSFDFRPACLGQDYDIKLGVFSGGLNGTTEIKIEN